jgi:FkbH-like protein
LLLPGSRAWRPLTERHRADFGAFGDWATVLTDAAESRALAWVLLLDDIVAADDVRLAGDDDALRSLLAPLLDLLDGVTTTARQTPVIVAWAGLTPGPVIAEARRPSAPHRLSRLLEDALYARAAACPALHIVPLDDVFARIGRDKAFDARNYYAGRCRLSSAGLGQLADALASLADRIETPARKLLALDCDNTLWGGVVGEDGIGGLTLGQDGLGAAFQDFQRVARSLTRQGTLLALASKNDEADVWQVFDSHPGMVLQRQDITAHRIDWNDKADNLAAIAEELGLGLDSFVFWDDNPLERAKLREALPQVLVPEVPADVTEWPRLLAQLAEFTRFEVTDEDRRKLDLYKARSRFVSAMSGQRDRTGFLKSIGLKPSPVGIDAPSVARAAQLSAKTNQFNLRCARRSAAELTAIAADPRACAFLARLADNYGDHGIVGLLVARPTDDPEIAFLDEFLLSCRVLGRHLEAWMLDHCRQALRRHGITHLVAEFVPHARNGMAASFLGNHGLQPLDEVAPALRDRLTAAATSIAQGGRLYAAALDRLSIPHLEVYADDDALVGSA